MPVLSNLRSWARQRRRLLAGLVGVAVETAAASVPGVNVAARFLGDMVEKAAEDALDPETGQPLPAEQLGQINAWLEQLSTSCAALLDRLEQLPLPETGPLDELTRQLQFSLLQSSELAKAFDDCLLEVRRQTLSLSLIERKLDEHFHAQQQVQASLSEIKDVFVHSPLMADWADFRRLHPDAVRALLEADEHFLAGRHEQGLAVFLALLEKRGIGSATLAHRVGIAEFGQGKLRQAATRLAQVKEPGALRHTATNLSTLSGKGTGLGVWRSLPRGFLINYKYRIEEEIGRGGMASVYRAVLTEEFERAATVAIKVPAPALVSDPALRQRFQKEIDRSRQLRHPNIVRVDGYEIFDDPHTRQRTYALVMEHVSGMSLSRFLALRKAANRRVGLDEVRHVMQAVCAALEYAHAGNLLHRDVKPHNVLVAPGVIKLADFGVARELDDGQDHLTRSGQAVGTLAYMPPEMQLPDPASPVGVAADVYMAGVLLQELLTLHPNGKLKEREDCPLAWRDLINDARHHDAERRPSTMTVFRERLFSSTSSAIRNGDPPREIVNSIGMRLVRIPAGRFLMGSPSGEEGRDADEGPQHEVRITRAFYLGVYPVTQAQWRQVCGNNPSWFCAAGDGRNSVKGLDTEDFPVESVSWEDAQAFLEALNAQALALGHHYRLPTEAEWEYACRAGMPSHQVFHVGDSLSSEQANFDGRSPCGSADTGPFLGRTCAVGSYPPNAWGLYDMHGNVWEWCADWFDKDYYRHSPTHDPAGPAEGSVRVFRGGSWDDEGMHCRSAYRSRNTPADRNCRLGFRVALVPAGE